MVDMFTSPLPPLQWEEIIEDEVRRFRVPTGWLYQVSVDVIDTRTPKGYAVSPASWRTTRVWSQPVFVPDGDR